MPRSWSGPTGWRVPPHARIGLQHRALGACRSRGGPGPAGHLRLQRPRVRRVHARVMAGAGRAVQRQLPLRQKRASVPARRFRRDRPDLSRDVRAAGHRRAAPASALCACSIQIADESGNDLVHGAVDYDSIVALRVCAAATGRAVTRRPVRPLHRRHDRACPKACCGVSTTSSCHAFGGRNMGTGELTQSYDEIAKRVTRTRAPRS